MLLRIAVFVALLLAVSDDCSAENPNGVVSERAAKSRLPPAKNFRSVRTTALPPRIYTVARRRACTFTPCRALQKWDEFPGCGCVAVRPDGAQVACGGASQVVHVWDCSTGTITNLNTGPNQKASSYFYSTNQVAFSPDSQSWSLPRDTWALEWHQFRRDHLVTADRPRTLSLHTPTSSRNRIVLTTFNLRPTAARSSWRWVQKDFDFRASHISGAKCGVRATLLWPRQWERTQLSQLESAWLRRHGWDLGGVVVCAMAVAPALLFGIPTQATTLELPVAADGGREVQLVAGGLLAVCDLNDIVIYQGTTQKRRYSARSR